MVERGQHDVVIVTGGDSSMNELFVQPEVRSFSDLKGRVAIVDAPNTAYAVQLKKILLLKGLKEGTDYTVKPLGGTFQRIRAMRENKDYAASMLNPPFSIEATNAGLRSLGRAIDLIGPYQASGAFVMRAWQRPIPTRSSDTSPDTSKGFAGRSPSPTARQRPACWRSG